jgi:polar amino acid transport system substrate-binding protein
VKHLFKVLVVFALFALVVTACGPATPAVVRVATDATFPPFEIVDEATMDLTGSDPRHRRSRWS